MAPELESTPPRHDHDELGACRHADRWRDGEAPIDDAVRQAASHAAEAIGGRVVGKHGLARTKGSALARARARAPEAPALRFVRPPRFSLPLLPCPRRTAAVAGGNHLIHQSSRYRCGQAT